MSTYKVKVNGSCQGVQLKKGSIMELSDEVAAAVGDDVELIQSSKAIEDSADKMVKKTSKK